MELIYEVIGSILLFALSFGLLYIINFNKEKRYKQLLYPLIALLIGLVFIRFEEIITHFYQQIFKERMTYIQLLLNLTYMLCFFAIKWVGKLGSNLVSNSQRLRGLYSSWRSKLWEDGTVAFVYTKNRGQTYLKKEWTYLSTFFKAASALPVFLLVLLIIANVYSLSFIQYLPKYPAVSLVLLMEIAWFLSGRKFPFSEGSIEGKDAISKRLATYEELFNQYKELWKERLIADGKVSENFHHRTDHFTYENISSSPEHQTIIHSICERLKKKNVIIDESYTTILSEIIQENDVMIEDVMYQEFSPYFFPALYHLLVKNKKLLVIAPNQRAVEEASTWFEKGMREVTGLEHVFRVSTFKETLEQNINTDVLIVSPDILLEKRFLLYFSQLEKTKNLECMVFLHAEKVIQSYSTILHSFNVNVRELIGKKPQYIIMTEWYEGLEHSVRTVLQCEPKDIMASSDTSPNLHYMVWKQEGGKWFQHTLLPKISHRQFEAEAVLALPALKANIEPIHFVIPGNTNVKASIQELADAKNSLVEMGFDIETLDHLPKMMQIHDDTLTVPMDDFTFLLIRDHRYNLIDALNLWKGTGKRASFVNIVSPPYLLRDYFASQLEFYISTNRTISPLSPRLSQSRWSLAYSLLERLCQFDISEEEVRLRLNKAGISSYSSVAEGIHDLFTNAFGPLMDYRLYIESKQEFHFDRVENEIVQSTLYRITYSAKEELSLKPFRFINITHHNETISEMVEGHFYQQYLPGQYHSFNGERYKIEKVDLDRGVVEVTFDPIFEEKYYRHMTEYRISQMEDEPHFENNISLEKFDFRLSGRHAHLDVSTSGYAEFNQLLNLDSMKLYSFNEMIQRSYENGHLLCMEMDSKEGHLENAAEIEFTLCFLLNELFLSLFPDTHHFVKAVTVLDESFFNVNDSISRKLRRITPTLQIDKPYPSKGQITFYFLEDSPYHLGLLETICDHWEKILEILHDYLYWLLHESNGSSVYLYFGYGQYPEDLALHETFTLLNNLLIGKKLQEVRTSYFTDGEMVTLRSSEIQCVFCGKEFSACQFHQLDDGRQRCFTGSQSAIDQVSQVEPLYQEVRQFFKDVYNVTLQTDIELNVLSSAEIHQMSGLPYIPNATHSRLTGKASIDVNGNLKVLIENGSPKNHTLSTLAHELTHIWQYENLDLKLLTLEEVEGFASWVEVHMMTQLGETPYADMLKQQLLKREDEYGRGYQMIVERLSTLPDDVTPFDLFAAEEVGA